MDGQKRAGSLYIWEMDSTPNNLVPVLWLDAVHLEPKYRGRGMMQMLLKEVLRDFTARPILVNSYKDNTATYTACGWRPVTKEESVEYAPHLSWHHRWMKYDRSPSEYRLMILK